MIQSNLSTILSNFHSLTEEEYKIFEGISKSISFSKKEYVLQNGNICKGIYFIEKGIIGKMEIIEGKEIYKNFFFEGDFATDMPSLSQQKPSLENLVAIEDVNIIFLPREELLGLYQVSPTYQELGRKLLEYLLIKQENYSSLLTSLSPKERYLHILENEQKLATRIPLQYLASYLGIARETLSRIRKKI